MNFDAPIIFYYVIVYKYIWRQLELWKEKRHTMKRLLLIAVVFFIALSFTGCLGGGSGGNGELVGVQQRQRFKETQPYGMVYIRRGSFNIGPSDQDASTSGVPIKTVSQEPFWMDDTEITNNEYRQFVHWVKEEMARTMLGDQYPEFLITEDRDGNPIDPPKINWREKIDWEETISPELHQSSRYLCIGLYPFYLWHRGQGEYPWLRSLPPRQHRQSAHRE